VLFGPSSPKGAASINEMKFGEETAMCLSVALSSFPFPKIRQRIKKLTSTNILTTWEVKSCFLLFEGFKS